MTLAILILFAAPFCLLAFSIGVVTGLWLSGALNSAPIISDDCEAEQGARIAGGILKR